MGAGVSLGLPAAGAILAIIGARLWTSPELKRALAEVRVDRGLTQAQAETVEGAVLQGHQFPPALRPAVGDLGRRVLQELDRIRPRRRQATSLVLIGAVLVLVGGILLGASPPPGTVWPLWVVFGICAAVVAPLLVMLFGVPLRLRARAKVAAASDSTAH